MIGTGAVIAQSFRRVAPHEDGAGIADFTDQAVGICHGKLKMLGRDTVRHSRRLVQIPDFDQGAAARQRGPNYLGALHARQ